MAILGHNGSGKSTLAKHLNAVLLPTGGNGLGGRDWTRADEALLLEIRRTRRAWYFRTRITRS